MSAEASYVILLEGLNEDKLTTKEARKILNEISVGLSDDQIEEVENIISEKEQGEIAEQVSYYDAFPIDSDWFNCESSDTNGTFYDWFDQDDE